MSAGSVSRLRAAALALASTWLLAGGAAAQTAPSAGPATVRLAATKKAAAKPPAAPIIEAGAVE